MQVAVLELHECGTYCGLLLRMLALLLKGMHVPFAAWQCRLPA